MCRRNKPNRKYTYESMRKRVREATSFEEIELIMDLMDDLLDTSLLTDYQYAQLHGVCTMKKLDMLLEDKA